MHCYILGLDSKASTKPHKLGWISSLSQITKHQLVTIIGIMIKMTTDNSDIFDLPLTIWLKLIIVK